MHAAEIDAPGSPEGRAGAIPSPDALVVALLGEVVVRKDGVWQPLSGARSRCLLASLALNAQRSRSARTLIEDIWGDQPPRAPMNALHTQVSRLRSMLPPGALEASPAGYRLALSVERIDVSLADAFTQRARLLHADGNHGGSISVIATARTLWRGEPGADLSGAPARELVERARTHWMTLDTTEVAARAALGDYDGALGPARRAAQHSPFDETAQLQLMKVLADAGKTTEALDVFASLRARCAEELGADPGPALTELNTAILRGEYSAAPPVGELSARGKTTVPAPIGLRAAPNAMVGRAHDLTAVDEMVPRSRVITVLGPGGTGKTRVANEIGRRWARRMHVALVELAGVDSGEDVSAAIVSSLGLSEVTRGKPGDIVTARIYSPTRRLREALADRATLLILDNCEHLIDAVAAVVAELVAACEELTVLTTSRAPLMIGAESVYQLTPLPVDTAGSPAVELFGARARAVRPSVGLRRDEVSRLCRTLDGLPLAIELAAARVRSLSVAEINAGLDRRFELLRGGDRTSPERHRTLHAVIGWSWNLLDVAQQATLRRLSRFPAGFTLNSARAVAEWGGVGSVDAALEGLVNQSLLSVVETPECGGIRYRMLETVREFGGQRLVEAGEEPVIETRMWDWARARVAGMFAAMQSDSQVEAMVEALAEQDNGLVVLRQATARCSDPTTPPAEFRHARFTAYTLYAGLGSLWVSHGRHGEALAWSDRIMAIPAPAPDDTEVPFDYFALAVMLAGGHALLVNDVRTTMRARMLVRRRLREDPDGLPWVRNAARLCCVSFDPRRVGRLMASMVRSPDELSRFTGLMVRAQAWENIGNVRGAETATSAALAIAERRSLVHGVSQASGALGSLCGQAARYADAVPHFRRAIEGMIRLGANSEAEQYRYFLTTALIGTGRLVEAHTILDNVAREAGAEHSQEKTDGMNGGFERLGAMMANRAELSLAEGDTEAGLAHYRRALQMGIWPIEDGIVGPFGVVLAGAVVAAHVLHGRAAEVATPADEIADYSVWRFDKYPDYPQIGVAAVVVGSHRLAMGGDPDVAMELMALGPRVNARQDYPSLLWHRHLRTARAALGDAVVEEAVGRATATARNKARIRILTLLRR